MRASGASELRKFLHFHILKLLFPSNSVGTYDTSSQIHIFLGLKLHLHIYYIINAVFLYYLWYGTMYKRQYTDNIVKIYMRASGASELRKFGHFYIIKVLFLSIWVGRNNHLQINILKHILRMHNHDFFCGEQSIYTHAILVN